MVAAALAPSSLADVAGLAPDEVLARLGSGPDGLSSDDVAERLRQFGPNALGTHRVRATAVLFRQIRNPILVLLLGAALVSGLTGGGTNARDHRRDRRPQRRSGLLQRVPGGDGDGRSARQDPAGGRGPERRTGEPGPGDEPRARRRGVAAHRRPRAGRPPLAEGRRTRVRRRRADRRVDAGGQVGGACRRPPAAGPAGMRLHGDDRPPGVGRSAWWSGPEPAPPSGRSPRAWPRSRARPPSRWACRVSRASCSRWRPC